MIVMVAVQTRENGSGRVRRRGRGRTERGGGEKGKGGECGAHGVRRTKNDEGDGEDGEDGGGCGERTTNRWLEFLSAACSHAPYAPIKRFCAAFGKFDRLLFSESSLSEDYFTVFLSLPGC